MIGMRSKALLSKWGKSCVLMNGGASAMRSWHFWRRFDVLQQCRARNDAPTQKPFQNPPTLSHYICQAFISLSASGDDTPGDRVCALRSKNLPTHFYCACVRTIKANRENETKKRNEIETIKSNGKYIERDLSRSLCRLLYKTRRDMNART